MRTQRTNNIRFAAWAKVLLALVAVSPGHAANDNPRVLPINSVSYGKTYAEWAAAWWQWALSIPAEHNPLADQTGADATQGQSGPVFYLAGVFGASGTAERTITVPAGKSLFFPVLNFIWISTVPSDPQTVEEIRAIVAPPADAASALACEIDGVSVNHLRNHRTESPLFDVTLPAANVFGVDGCPCTFGPSLDQGYYLMLAPLSAGQHTVHFHGSLPADIPPYWFAFTLDVTYHITVR